MTRVLRVIGWCVLALMMPAGAWAGQLTLTWTDNSVDEQGFKVERCQVIAPATTCANYLQIASVPVAASVGATAVWVNANLATGLTYCYRVRAFNTTGNSGYTNEACGVVAPPAAPLDPSNLQAQ